MSEENSSQDKNSFVSLPRSAERLKKLMNLVSGEKSAKPGGSQSKRRARSTPVRSSFKSFVLRLKRLASPRMTLGSLTVEELDNFIVHMIDLLEEELHRLCRMNNMKTLSNRDVETAVKLCYPPDLADSSDKYGKLAVSKYAGEFSMLEKDVFVP